MTRKKEKDEIATGITCHLPKARKGLRNGVCAQWRIPWDC